MAGGLSIKEAREILNVSETATEDEITASYKHIYEANGPEKGNSFYLQSKAFRAHETLMSRLGKEGDGEDDADLRPPESSKVADKQ